MTKRLTDQHLDEIEKHARQPYRQKMTLTTTDVRRMIDEIHELRDVVCVLQLKVDGSKAIVDAVVEAARADVDTKLSTITIPRPSGPSFHLIDALRTTRSLTILPTITQPTDPDAKEDDV